jgi:hypothetical protein
VRRSKPAATELPWNSFWSPRLTDPSDDVLITALGTPEEFPAEQQEKFRAGLKQVLNNLRLKNVRDFDTIAAEVVAHRRTFLGDASKILMLEGTSI